MPRMKLTKTAAQNTAENAASTAKDYVIHDTTTPGSC